MARTGTRAAPRRRASGHTLDPVKGPDADAVFAALCGAFRVPGTDSGLVEIRRAGNQAVLMFRWPPEDRLFGVPVPLAPIDGRFAWVRSTTNLDDWLELVDLWIMEDVDNGYRYRARRHAVDDYIELREPAWPADGRFYLQVDQRIDQNWTLLGGTDGCGDAAIALAAQDKGALLAWIIAYENNPTGTPIVGHSTVTRDGPDVARLVDLVTGDNVPATVSVELVRYATHTAAEAGAQTVLSDVDLHAWHPDIPSITGFRPSDEGMRVATDFLAEDAALADSLFEAALADPGRWGDDTDRSDSYVPPHT